MAAMVEGLWLRTADLVTREASVIRTLANRFAGRAMGPGREGCQLDGMPKEVIEQLAVIQDRFGPPVEQA